MASPQRESSSNDPSSDSPHLDRQDQDDATDSTALVNTSTSLGAMSCAPGDQSGRKIIPSHVDQDNMP